MLRQQDEIFTCNAINFGVKSMIEFDIVFKEGQVILTF
jgi:hypothetical protein